MDSNKSILAPSIRMKRLVDASHDIEIDRNIPINRYFKSSRELVKSAVCHQESGDIEKAFVLYLRHMSLILEKLPSHPEWNMADKNEKIHAKNQCNIIFDLAEKLKIQLKEKFEKEYETSLKSEVTESTAKQLRASQSIRSTKEFDALDEIDKKFNFKGEVPSESNKVLDNLFDLDKLRESLSSNR